jgi:cytochrome c oxidase subunit 2
MAPYAEHSALHPAGVQAARILALFYAYLDVSALVFTLVILALGFALGLRKVDVEEKSELSAPSSRNKRRAVVAATAATVFVLLGLLVASVATGHAMSWQPQADMLQVEVTGHEWWWEFRYPVKSGATRFSTAYELHIPVGQPVALKLAARDVIHSFWVPSLTGKRDAIPGRDTVLVLRADHPGVYEGQCAEFCGTEHANMRFLVIAEPRDMFDAWSRHQLEAAPKPSDPLLSRGEQVFLNSRCSLCHSISGTEAFGTVGPDLTHVASRERLAMGTVNNDPTHLRSWLEDPQSIKPGVQMPSTPLSPEDRRALLAYLEGLK